MWFLFFSLNRIKIDPCGGYECLPLEGEGGTK